ncbi:hypothetical protein GCM10010271_70140 [Streptomyces kurssanovii]|nr:hypothetical protein GCM10010271_70140 [Streptomyces kurssanovii]
MNGERAAAAGCPRCTAPGAAPPQVKLFWTHVNPYSRFQLDTNSRLDPDLTARAASVPAPRIPQAESAEVST